MKQHLKEGINLDNIVESVLQEYPGQPKDYDASDEFKDDYADEMNDLAGDYDTDIIDPEIEDEELGLRFD